jgi:hypothetical protein
MLTILKEAMNIGLKSCSSICHSDFKPPILFKSVIVLGSTETIILSIILQLINEAVQTKIWPKGQ